MSEKNGSSGKLLELRLRLTEEGAQIALEGGWDLFLKYLRSPVIVARLLTEADVVRKELEILNDRIDRKIIRGLSYAVEARRHKTVLAELARVRRASDFSWFGKTFSFVSTFVL